MGGCLSLPGQEEREGGTKDGSHSRRGNKVPQDDIVTLTTARLYQGFNLHGAQDGLNQERYGEQWTPRKASHLNEELHGVGVEPISPEPIFLHSAGPHAPLDNQTPSCSPQDPYSPFVLGNQQTFGGDIWATSPATSVPATLLDTLFEGLPHDHSHLVATGAAACQTTDPQQDSDSSPWVVQPSSAVQQHGTLTQNVGSVGLDNPTDHFSGLPGLEQDSGGHEPGGSGHSSTMPHNAAPRRYVHAFIKGVLGRSQRAVLFASKRSTTGGSQGEEAEGAASAACPESQKHCSNDTNCRVSAGTNVGQHGSTHSSLGGHGKPSRNPHTHLQPSSHHESRTGSHHGSGHGGSVHGSLTKASIQSYGTSIYGGSAFSNRSSPRTTPTSLTATSRALSLLTRASSGKHVNSVPLVSQKSSVGYRSSLESMLAASSNARPGQLSNFSHVAYLGNLPGSDEIMPARSGIRKLGQFGSTSCIGPVPPSSEDVAVLPGNTPARSHGQSEPGMTPRHQQQQTSSNSFSSNFFPVGPPSLIQLTPLSFQLQQDAHGSPCYVAQPACSASHQQPASCSVLALQDSRNPHLVRRTKVSPSCPQLVARVPPHTHTSHGNATSPAQPTLTATQLPPGGAVFASGSHSTPCSSAHQAALGLGHQRASHTTLMDPVRRSAVYRTPSVQFSKNDVQVTGLPPSLLSSTRANRHLHGSSLFSSPFGSGNLSGAFSSNQSLSRSLNSNEHVRNPQGGTSISGALGLHEPACPPGGTDDSSHSIAPQSASGILARHSLQATPLSTNAQLPMQPGKEQSSRGPVSSSCCHLVEHSLVAQQLAAYNAAGVAGGSGRGRRGVSLDMQPHQQPEWQQQEQKWLEQHQEQLEQGTAQVGAMQGIVVPMVSKPDDGGAAALAEKLRVSDMDTGDWQPAHSPDSEGHPYHNSINDAALHAGAVRSTASVSGAANGLDTHGVTRLPCVSADGAGHATGLPPCPKNSSRGRLAAPVSSAATFSGSLQALPANAQIQMDQEGLQSVATQSQLFHTSQPPSQTLHHNGISSQAQYHQGNCPSFLSFPQQQPGAHPHPHPPSHPQLHPLQQPQQPGLPTDTSPFQSTCIQSQAMTHPLHLSNPHLQISQYGAYSPSSLVAGRVSPFNSPNRNYAGLALADCLQDDDGKDERHRAEDALIAACRNALSSSSNAPSASSQLFNEASISPRLPPTSQGSDIPHSSTGAPQCRDTAAGTQQPWQPTARLQHSGAPPEQQQEQCGSASLRKGPPLGVHEQAKRKSNLSMPLRCFSDSNLSKRHRRSKDFAMHPYVPQQPAMPEDALPCWVAEEASKQEAFQAPCQDTHWAMKSMPDALEQAYLLHSSSMGVDFDFKDEDEEGEAKVSSGSSEDDGGEVEFKYDMSGASRPEITLPARYRQTTQAQHRSLRRSKLHQVSNKSKSAAWLGHLPKSQMSNMVHDSVGGQYSSGPSNTEHHRAAT